MFLTIGAVLFGIIILLILVAIILGIYKTFKEYEAYPYFINHVDDYPSWKEMYGKAIMNVEVLNSANIKITFDDETHIILNAGEYILNIQTLK